MNKLIINFEYGGYPVWIYNDGDELIINDLPWELSEEIEIDDSFTEIQNIYDRLYKNNSGELKYIGFKSEADKAQFIISVDNAINLIKMKTGGLYFIEKRFNIKKL